MKSRFTYLSLLAGIILSSCSDITPYPEAGPLKEGCITFSASNARMITKSGLEYEEFEAGTKYLLYGVTAAGEYDWNSAILNKAQCHETEDHYIHYGPDIHFHDNTYDFYGATICSTGESESDYPTDIAPATSGPVISLSMEDNKLDDLMYSNNLKGCTQSSGLLQMNFIHALSKIQVEVSKQSDIEELRYAKIKKITLQNTHSEGELDIIEGSWTLGGEPVDRVYMQSEMTLGTAAAMVKDASGNAAEMLIFPNNGSNETIGVEIVYTLDEEGSNEITASCDILTPNSESPFLFEQNYRYTLSIIVSHDGVLVVSILPKVYDWIDEAPFNYLGQPVTFGNLMWMDRNLGALSADYEHDWYNTIGHYFQFGRNIPYILDVEKFKEYTGDGYFAFNFAGKHVYVMKYRNRHTGVENQWYYDNDKTDYYTKDINLIASEGYKNKHGVEWNGLSEAEKTQLIMNAVECIYTYNHLGEKVYGVKYVAPSDPNAIGNSVVNADPELVRSPDRLGAYAGMSDAELTELYKFGFGTKLPGTQTNVEKPTVWTFDNSCGAEYWTPGDSHADPCPKGWRLPTKEDLLVLMPSVQINWATSGAYPQTRTTATEDIRFGTTGGHHVCYILKNKGTVNAYRLRIMSHHTQDGLNNKRYFSISRYGATKDDQNLDKYLSGNHGSTSKEKTMWANPIETICYPACGFIVPDGDGTADTVHPDMRSFGTGTVIRTADSNPDAMAGSDGSSAQGFSYVQYLSTTDYELSIQQHSRRSLGDQIRCVRDINAID